jgi:hypothetical protein
MFQVNANDNNLNHLNHGEPPMSEFDFTFFCPVYVLRSESGYLVADDRAHRALCMWTDANAALSFLDRSSGRLTQSFSLVEVETDYDLLKLLFAIYEDGIEEIAVDLADAYKTTVQMLYVLDLLEAAQERIALRELMENDPDEFSALLEAVYDSEQNLVSDNAVMG